MKLEATVDLQAYLDRIGFDRSVSPTFESLSELQSHHLEHIPFENLDVVLRRGIAIDLGSLQRKLILRRRGGYCFEQNTLFASVLQQIGFELDTLEARVRPPDTSEILPRTHMVLRVVVDRRSWLVDVGFGGDGSASPVPLDGEPSAQAGLVYRVEPESERVHVLQRRWQGAWSDLYAFTLEPALPVDYVVANHFTSTHPDSIFRRTLTVQRFDGDRRHILRNRLYTVRRGEKESVRELDRHAVVKLIREVMQLDVSDEEISRALDQNA